MHIEDATPPMLLLKRTARLVLEVFDDMDKVGADVVLLHGCPQSCMPTPVECLLEGYEDMVEFFSGAGDVSHI